MKAWASSGGCYTQCFVQMGGFAVNGTYQTMSTTPFFPEYQLNPAPKGPVEQLRGLNNLDADALHSYMEALLFHDAAEKAVANDAPVTRTSLFNTLNTDETLFYRSGHHRNGERVNARADSSTSGSHRSETGSGSAPTRPAPGGSTAVAATSWIQKQFS